MNIQAQLKKVKLSWKTLFAVALILFIIFGFGTKLIMSANMSLNSDMVGEGLEIMDIWDHHNYLLSGYYMPSQDTFLFTELPFQLLPQILTGYSPLALKLVSFAIFGLTVAALAYIVFMVSGEPVCALLFAALAANLPPAGYYYFVIPTSHGATMLYLCAILILLLYVGKKEEAALKDKAKKHKKTQTKSTNVQWAFVTGLGVLVALSAISDTIILTWFIIPYILAYVLFARDKSRTMNWAVACMTAVSALAYVFKTYFVYNWVVQDFLTQNTKGIFSANLSLYFTSLAVLLNQGLSWAFGGFKGFGILEAASLIIFIALVAFAVKNSMGGRQKRFFYAVLLLSGIAMFAMFLVSGYTIDSSSARYLTFTALSVLIFIAVSYRENDKIYAALALALLVVCAVDGYQYFGQNFGQPNAQEYGLISFLKENNLTFGYSTYWDSNIITYLSHQDVKVRATLFYRDDLRPNVWLASEWWYQSTPDRSFILVDNSTLDANGRNVVGALTSKLNASEPLHYGKYDIYPLQGYHIAPFQVQR